MVLYSSSKETLVAVVYNLFRLIIRLPSSDN